MPPPLIPDELINVLRSADSIAALTGAGVSAESGIPTFRDALTGLWVKYDPKKLATPEAFREDPARVTRWYDERRLMIGKCRPNAGHDALARMERIITNRGGLFTLITQNIDGLHQASGSENVLELHGSIWEWICNKTQKRVEFRKSQPIGEYPPRLEDGGMLRPSVVWFGEALPAGVMERAEEAVRACDLFMMIGTSAEVYPAAGLVDVAGHYAARCGGTVNTVEVNTEKTSASRRVTWSIRGKSGEILPALVERAFGTESGL